MKKKIINVTQIAREITKREGKKQQVNIAQASEVVAVLSDMLVTEDGVAMIYALIANGKRRARRSDV